MKRAFFLAASMIFWAIPATAQSAADAEVQRLRAELQAGQIRENVPAESDFSRLLQRDLEAHFALIGISNPSVEFELLRQGATQSGVAYPKFYLWVRIQSDRGAAITGAVRVAAVARTRFDVTNFLSAKEINDQPNRVAAIFPKALEVAIIERAQAR